MRDLLSVLVVSSFFGILYPRLGWFALFTGFLIMALKGQIPV